MSLSFNTNLEGAEWLKPAKVAFFQTFSKKIKDRLKICAGMSMKFILLYHLLISLLVIILLALGSLLDDFADYEQLLGKSLTRAYDGNRNTLSNVILVSVLNIIYLF